MLLGGAGVVFQTADYTLNIGFCMGDKIVCEEEVKAFFRDGGIIVIEY